MSSIWTTTSWNVAFHDNLLNSDGLNSELAGLNFNGNTPDNNVQPLCAPNTQSWQVFIENFDPSPGPYCPANTPGHPGDPDIKIVVEVTPESVQEDASGVVSGSIAVTLVVPTRTSDTSVAVSEPGNSSRYVVSGLGSPLTIAAGQYRVEDDFTIDPTDNRFDDGDLTVTFTANPDVTGWANATDTMHIVDDDEPSTAIIVEVSPESVQEDASGAVSASVTVSLDDAVRSSATSVTVSVSSDNDSRYAFTGLMSPLTIPADETSVSDDFTITPTDNNIDDGDLAVTFTGDPDVTGWANVTDSLLIVDDDEPSTGITVQVTPANVQEDVSGAVSASITVSLDVSATGD